MSAPPLRIWMFAAALVAVCGLVLSLAVSGPGARTHAESRAIQVQEAVHPRTWPQGTASRWGRLDSARYVLTTHALLVTARLPVKPVAANGSQEVVLNVLDHDMRGVVLSTVTGCTAEGTWQGADTVDTPCQPGSQVTESPHSVRFVVPVNVLRAAHAGSTPRLDVDAYWSTRSPRPLLARSALGAAHPLALHAIHQIGATR